MKFEQLSLKAGFMKHNGGLLFKKISKTEYEFKTTINKNHLIPLEKKILASIPKIKF